MSLRRFIPAILALGMVAQAAEPLYLEFRPLTSLPWMAPGATWEQVIRRLYREPDQFVRSTLLEEYLKQARASDFPRLFDLCVRLQEEDAPDGLLEQLLRAWGRKDAAAAWAKCNALYEVIVPQEPLDVDSWGTGIIVLNARAVAASAFWPRSAQFAAAFSEGVAESALSEGEKHRYIARQQARSQEWQAAYDAAEKNNLYRGVRGGETDQASPPTPAQEAEREANLAKQHAEEEEQERRAAALRHFLPEILASPPMEIQARLSAAGPEGWDEAILARALIRWMDGDARRGPEIVEYVLNSVDPHGVLRKISTSEPVPIEFLVEWAILDLAGFKKWALPEKEGRPGLREKSRAVVQAFAYRNDTAGILDSVVDYETEENDKRDKNEAAFDWAELDPANALPWIWSHGGIRAYGDAADACVYSSRTWGSNVIRSIFASFDDYVVPIPDEILYRLMEEWSSVDAAACARHGVRWNLRTRLFTKKRMIRLWTGFENPDDGSVDDRHYGSLRIWAILKPKEMREWIYHEPLDNDVRAALLWLVDHAKGGFNLRTDGSTAPRR